MPLSLTVIVRPRRRRSTSPSIATSRRHAGATELERVGDQVLHQLAHLQGVAADRGQRADVRSAAPEPLDLVLEVVEDLARRPARRSTASNGRPCVATRENFSRSSISRLHPLGGRVGPPQIVVALARESCSASVTDSCSVNVRTLRSGSWRSWEAIEANCSSSALDRASSAARRSSCRVARLERVVGELEARVGLGAAPRPARSTRRPSSSDASATSAKATKMIHGTHLRSPRRSRTAGHRAPRARSARSSSTGAPGRSSARSRRPRNAPAPAPARRVPKHVPDRDRRVGRRDHRVVPVDQVVVRPGDARDLAQLSDR